MINNQLWMNLKYVSGIMVKNKSMNQQFENKHSISTDVATFNKSKSSVLIKKLL